MSAHIFSTTSENALSLNIYSRGNASCLLSHLNYFAVNAVSKKMRRLDTLSQQLNAPSWLLKSYFIQELCKRGILSLGSHNLNLAHSEQDVQTLLAVYAEVLPALIRLDADKAVHQALDGEPIQPVFKVR